MPVEIKELHLKFNIDDGSSTAASLGSSSTKTDASSNSCSTSDSVSSQRLVQTTTDEVMRIIEAKREER